MCQNGLNSNQLPLMKLRYVNLMGDRRSNNYPYTKQLLLRQLNVYLLSNIFLLGLLISTFFNLPVLFHLVNCLPFCESVVNATSFA